MIHSNGKFKEIKIGRRKILSLRVFLTIIISFFFITSCSDQVKHVENIQKIKKKSWVVKEYEYFVRTVPTLDGQLYKLKTKIVYIGIGIANARFHSVGFSEG